ncbi:MAG: sugar ABC transporter permease [Spirochaetales bacterium]|nr:sugar ABC transporter permease [Spirochaetales bacterium]
MKRHNGRDAALFLAPTAVTYAVFLYIPIVSCFVIAMSDYDILSPLNFIGFSNFKRLFTYDRTLSTYLTTFKLAGMVVILHTIIGLMMALIVRHFHRRFQSVLRSIYYLPSILTTASVAIAWRYIFHSDLGILNYFLRQLGLSNIPWLLDPQWVYGSIAVFSVWKFVGGAFLYYLIGLETIPESLYEAAKIDGAGSVSTFRHITLPMLTPTIFFVVLNLCIGATQMFDEPFFLTGGGPGDASRTVNLFLYEVAYKEFNFGYASAIAISLFFVLAIFTIVQVKASNKWVTYDRA